MDDRVTNGKPLELREAVLRREGRELAKNPIVPLGRETAVAVQKGQEVSGGVEHVLRMAARGGEGVPGIGNGKRGDRPRLHAGERHVHRRRLNPVGPRVQRKRGEFHE
jgi:hypothetical protein